MIQIKRQVISGIPVLELFENGKSNHALPTVFFYHGWESRKERVLEYGYVLANNGFRAVLPEAVHHGERKEMNDEEKDPMNFWAVIANSVREFPILVNDYIEKQKTEKNTVGVAGLSMGGMTVNAMLTQYPWIHSAAVLMGSPSPIKYSRWLLENYKVGGTPLYDLLDREEVDGKLTELEPISLDLHPEAINRRPVYYWHGTEDPIVPFHLTKQFIDEIKGESYSQKVIFDSSQGVEHEVPQEIILRMSDFFKKN